MNENFFNSKLFNIFTCFTNLMLVNVCWIALCLPIFTAGASTAALYFCMEQQRTDDLVYPVKTFWKAFRENFKQGTILLVIIALVAAVAVVDVFLILRLHKLLGGIVTLILLLPFILTLPALFYIFPLQGNYANTVKNTLLNAWKMAMAHPLTSIGVIVINILPIAAGLMFPIILPYVIMLSLAFGGAVPALLSMVLLHRVFYQYDESEEE